MMYVTFQMYSFFIQFLKTFPSIFYRSRVLCFCTQEWSTNGRKIEKFQTFFFCVFLFRSLIRIRMTKHTQISFYCIWFWLQIDWQQQSLFVRSFMKKRENAKKCSHCFKSKRSIFIFAMLKSLFRPSKKQNLCVECSPDELVCTMKIHPVHRFNVNQSISTRWNHPLT